MSTKFTGAVQVLTANLLSVPSAAIGSNVVRIATTTDIYFSIGANPVANSSCSILPLGSVETIVLNTANSINKVAVMRVTANGVVSLTEVRS